MNDVIKYWKNPLFLIGIFLCTIGTLITITGLHHFGVLSELAGFAIITISIYIVDAKDRFN